jgi:hypothetical protein
MTRDDITRMAREAGFVGFDGDTVSLRRFAALVAAAEREAVLITVDELMGSEKDRHPMFSDGYDYALGHIEEFVKGRANR